MNAAVLPRLPEAVLRASRPEARWAIYFAPATSAALWHFGSHWLGRDAATGVEFSTPSVPGLGAEDVSAITAAPRRYGFHATLKAPFRLAPDTSPADLFTACGSFAQQHRAFSLGVLVVRSISGFLALMPETAPTTLAQFAFGCVQALDRLRAPAPEAERLRREQAGLTPRQREMLDTWGYPYVDEEFRFHMTLTDRLDDRSKGFVLPELQRRYAALDLGAVVLDGIGLFVEPEPGAPFTMVHRFALQP